MEGALKCKHLGALGQRGALCTLSGEPRETSCSREAGKEGSRRSSTSGGRWRGAGCPSNFPGEGFGNHRPGPLVPTALGHKS